MAQATRIPTWTFGERLAKAREDAGITQDEMAQRFGLSHSTVAKWEGDKSQPRDLFAIVEQWSKETGVDELWLLKGEARWAARDSNPEPAGLFPELPFVFDEYEQRAA